MPPPTALGRIFMVRRFACSTLPHQLVGFLVIKCHVIYADHTNARTLGDRPPRICTVTKSTFWRWWRTLRRILSYRITFTRTLSVHSASIIFTRLLIVNRYYKWFKKDHLTCICFMCVAIWSRHQSPYSSEFSFPLCLQKNAKKMVHVMSWSIIMKMAIYTPISFWFFVANTLKINF